MKLDGYAPEQKTTTLRNIVDKCQGSHDAMFVLEEGPNESDVAVLETQIETGERVFGFMEQVCAMSWTPLSFGTGQLMML